MKVPISVTKSATSKLRNIETRSGAPNRAEFRPADVFNAHTFIEKTDHLSHSESGVFALP